MCVFRSRSQFIQFYLKEQKFANLSIHNSFSCFQDPGCTTNAQFSCVEKRKLKNYRVLIIKRSKSEFKIKGYFIIQSYIFKTNEKLELNLRRFCLKRYQNLSKPHGGK